MSERAWIGTHFVSLRANATELGDDEAVFRFDSIMGTEINAPTPDMMPVITFRQGFHSITPE
jgi:hypothetical protein